VGYAMDKYEAILKVSKLIDSEREGLKKSAINYDSNLAPETSPDQSSIQLRVGTWSYFSAQLTALADFEGLDASDLLELMKYYENGRFENDNLLNFLNTTRTLIYLYLDSKEIDPYSETPRAAHRQNLALLEELKQNNFTFESGAQEVSDFSGYGGRSIYGYYVFLTHIPDEHIKPLEESISEMLKGASLDSDFKQALIKFPKNLNEHYGADTDMHDMDLFKSRTSHEITHDYIFKHSDRNPRDSVELANSLHEGFAWFADKYERTGIDFTIGSDTLSEYSNSREKAWLIDIIRKKAKHSFESSGKKTVVDWARINGAEVLSSDNLKKSFFKFILPEEARSDLKEFDKILEEIVSIESRLLEESQRERKALVSKSGYDELYDIDSSKFDIAKKASTYDTEIVESKPQSVYSSLYSVEQDIGSNADPKEIEDNIHERISKDFWKRKLGFEELYEEVEEIVYSYLNKSTEEIMAVKEDLDKVEQTVEYTGLSEPGRMEELISEYRSLIEEIEKFSNSIE